MLRIISGKHKNRKLFTTLKGEHEIAYRPTSDRNRQSIFSIIHNSRFIPQHFLKDAIVADIFSGSGAFGLEALSQGASIAIFVDNASERIRVARRNAELLNEQCNSVFITADAVLLPPATQRCDIVYLDPPYGSELANKVLKKLVQQGWLAEHNLVIIEAGIKDDVVMPDKFELIDQRQYGVTKLIFCSYHERT